MKVVDARSGKEMKIGDVADWGNGEYIRLLDVDEGLLTASAFVEIASVDHSQDELEETGTVIPMFAKGHPVAFSKTYIVKKRGPVVKIKRQINLTVRWLHPNYLFKKTAFIES